MNTELLEKIERNNSPKTSTQIVVSDNSTKIKTTTFNPPLELDRTRSTNWLWSISRHIILFRICLMKTMFSDILLVSLKLGGVIEGLVKTIRDKDNGSKFKFLKAITISLTL